MQVSYSVGCLVVEQPHVATLSLVAVARRAHLRREQGEDTLRLDVADPAR